MTSPSGPADPILLRILDAVPSLVFVVDADLRVQAFNAAAAEVLAAVVRPAASAWSATASGRSSRPNGGGNLSHGYFPECHREVVGQLKKAPPKNRVGSRPSLAVPVSRSPVTRP
jgi:hypothetical protein